MTLHDCITEIILSFDVDQVTTFGFIKMAKFESFNTYKKLIFFLNNEGTVQ